MKNTTKKRVNIILSLLLVLALAAPVIAPPSIAEAANKKQTVGAFTLKVPSDWTRTNQNVGQNIQAMFTAKTPGVGFLAQSTDLAGYNPSDEEIKPILKTVLETQYGDSIKNVKYGTKKTGIGKAVMVSCKITSGGVSANCRMYAVCKGGNMFMAIGVGTSKKVETKILKSVKVK